MPSKSAKAADGPTNPHGTHIPLTYHQPLFLNVQDLWETLIGSGADISEISVEEFWGSSVAKFLSPCRITQVMSQVNPFLLSSAALDTVLPLALSIRAQTLLANERFLTLTGQALISGHFDMDDALCARYVAIHTGHATQGKNQAEFMRASWIKPKLKAD